MRILFVLEHYHPYIGGAETLFRDLTRELARLGHAVTVVTTRFDPLLPAQEVLEGVTVHRVNCRNRFLFSILALPAVRHHAKRADLVHTTTYNAAPPAWIGAKLSGKPVVITFHELWGKLWFRLPFISRPAALAYYCFEQLVFRLPFDRYVAVSDFTARTLVRNGLERQRVTRIYNGLAAEDFPSAPHCPPDRFTITYFGRLGISKGLEILLPAVSRFTGRHPEARLRLIIPRRPAALYRRILARIGELGVGERVELLHELPWAELRERVRSSSCVVIPSHSEGFCYVAAETVALGVPIVHSGRGALAETVSGRSVEMREMSVAALDEALEAAFLGEWTTEPVKKFPLADSIREYTLFYEDI